MGKDKFFSKKMDSIKSFEFDENVAKVFDDMVSRSVPFYDEIHRIILDLLDRAYQGGPIYDLGCSTGTTFAIIAKHLENKNIVLPEFIGIDNSAAMLKKCHEKMALNNIKNASFQCQDLRDTEINNAGMVIMNYTLQFIDKENRKDLITNIYDGLEEGGLFILSEKIISKDDKIDDLLVELYYDFKRRNGYSDLEISQKREALENVLVPMTPEEQIDQLKNAGFKKVEMIFRWYNFACYMGIK
jgi:tRNA (cmo5U34)-methyltransferase